MRDPGKTDVPGMKRTEDRPDWNWYSRNLN